MMRSLLDGRKRPSSASPGRAAILLLAVLAGCGEPTGRWSGTDWWTSYAALPEVSLTPISAGALDETTQPFPGVRDVAVSPGGRVAVVQEGIPAVWVYDERGRSLGRVGRAEIMDLRGPERTRVWAERAGWLPGERLWVAERGGAVAVFNRDLDFSDVWERSGGHPLVVTAAGGLLSLVLSEDDGGYRLDRVRRGGAASPLVSLGSGDSLVVCPDAGCFTTLISVGDTTGSEVTTVGITEGPGGSLSLPPAPDGTRAAEGAPLPRAVARFFVDDARRTWLGLAEDDSGRAYWLLLDPAGVPIGRFHLPAGEGGLMATGDTVWTRREAEGVTWLHRYAFQIP